MNNRFPSKLSYRQIRKKNEKIHQKTQKNTPQRTSSNYAVIHFHPFTMCDVTFKTENGLKIHIGKSHKEALSPEKMRKPSSQSSLTVSPIRDQSRVEHCHNCGMDMSPSHQCNFDQDSTLGDGPEFKELTTCPAVLNGRVDCGCAKWNQPCLYRTPDWLTS